MELYFISRLKVNMKKVQTFWKAIIKQEMGADGVLMKCLIDSSDAQHPPLPGVQRNNEITYGTVCNLG